MPKAQAKKSKRIFLFLRIGVVLCVVIWEIFWVSREVGWGNLAKTLLSVNPGIFALVLGVFIVAQIIIGLRWWILLRSQSIFIKFWAAVRLYLLGWFYNNFMPGSVGGDLLRAWYVTRHTDKKFEAVLSVFVDRVIGLASTLIIAAFFYLLFIRGQGQAIPFESQIGFVKLILFWAVIVIAAFFCMLLLHKRGRLLLLKVWAYIRLPVVRMIIKLKDAIVIYCRNPLSILIAFGLTVFLQLLTITGFWLLGRNIGIEAGVVYYYVFFTLAWVLGAVPISIAGAGVVEGLLASLFFTVAGVAKHAASALALCQRAVWMLASLPGAVIHLIGAHLPGEAKVGVEGREDFFIDYNKPID